MLAPGGLALALLSRISIPLHASQAAASHETNLILFDFESLGLIRKQISDGADEVLCFVVKGSRVTGHGASHCHITVSCVQSFSWFTPHAF